MGTAIIIKNVSFADFGLGKVTISNSTPIEAISIEGSTSIIGTQSYYKAHLYPINTSERSIVWSVVSGSNYATINSSTGILTILSTANNSSVVIQATSAGNPNIKATLSLTLTYHGDTYGENLTSQIVWNSGYYKQDYSIGSSSVSFYSNAISVNKDDILFCKVCGIGLRPVVECNSDLSNKKYGIYTYSATYMSSTDTYNYAYHISDDGFVSFCSKQNEYIAFWKAEKTLDITPVWNSGYIDLNGNVQSSSVTKHSEPISISANSLLVVETAGTGFSIVSLTNAAGTEFTPILKQTGGNVEDNGDFVTSIDPPLTQSKTPCVCTLGTWYQGTSNPTNTPMKYTVYIEEDCLVSVCGKTTLPVNISIYKAG